MVDESVDLPPVVPSLRVALDRTGKITSGPLLDTAMAPTLLFTSAATPDATLGLWKKAGVQVCVVPCDGSQRLSLTAVLDELGARGVLQLLVEGGSETHSEFLRARLVDEVHMYKGSTVLGHGGIPWVTADMARTITDANFWYGQELRHHFYSSNFDTRVLGFFRRFPSVSEVSESVFSSVDISFRFSCLWTRC